MRLDRYARYAWAVLGVNLLVVAWGALVRASGSGAGCGSHWPLCNGQVVPSADHSSTIIEFTHRVTSGMALLAVVVLLVWALRRHAASRDITQARAALAVRQWPQTVRSAAVAMAFMISEALVGAGLVLFGLVGDNSSALRAVVLGVHLVNTFFLLASIALTAWFASGGAPVQLRGQGAPAPLLLGAIGATVLLGVTGTITALGDTLFPTASLAEGFRQDFAPAAHFLLRLRVIHPLLAVTLALYVLAVAAVVLRRRPTSPASQWLARAVVALFFAQVAAGTLNLLLRAPIWMQIVHLALADALWITLVLLAAAALAAPQAQPLSRADASRAAPARRAEPPRPAARATR